MTSWEVFAVSRWTELVMIAAAVAIALCARPADARPVPRGHDLYLLPHTQSAV